MNHAAFLLNYFMTLTNLRSLIPEIRKSIHPKIPQ